MIAAFQYGPLRYDHNSWDSAAKVMAFFAIGYAVIFVIGIIFNTSSSQTKQSK